MDFQYDRRFGIGGAGRGLIGRGHGSQGWNV